MKDKQEELRLELHTKFNLVFNEAVAANTVDRLVKYLDSFKRDTRTQEEWHELYKSAMIKASKPLFAKYKDLVLKFQFSADPEMWTAESGDFSVIAYPKELVKNNSFLEDWFDVNDAVEEAVGYYTLIDKHGWFNEEEDFIFELNN